MIAAPYKNSLKTPVRTGSARARRLAGLCWAIAVLWGLLLLAGCSPHAGGGTAGSGAATNDPMALAGSDLHNSLEAGKKVDCANNLSQIRLALKMQHDDGNNPARLTDIPGLGGLLNCPTSQKPYQYDPASGRVWCTTPGHEKL